MESLNHKNLVMTPFDPERLAKALRASLKVGAVYLPLKVQNECTAALAAYEAHKALEARLNPSRDDLLQEDNSEAF